MNNLNPTIAAIQIKHRWTGAVLFEGESGMTMRQTLEKATVAKTDLRGAILSDADLRGASLSGASLSGASLRVADLRGASLRGADLRGAILSDADLRGASLSGASLSVADLRGASLSGADLSGASLSGASLSGKTLAGDRPFFTIGPIGSRYDYIQAWTTDRGLMLRAGCFFGTKAAFEEKLSDEHGDNQHAQEYRAALVLIDKHAELWTPAVEAVAEQETSEVAA